MRQGQGGRRKCNEAGAGGEGEYVMRQGQEGRRICNEAGAGGKENM